MLPNGFRKVLVHNVKVKFSLISCTDLCCHLFAIVLDDGIGNLRLKFTTLLTLFNWVNIFSIFVFLIGKNVPSICFFLRNSRCCSCKTGSSVLRSLTVCHQRSARLSLREHSNYPFEWPMDMRASAARRTNRLFCMIGCNNKHKNLFFYSMLPKRAAALSHKQKVRCSKSQHFATTAIFP